ncbi:neprilysin-1-like isoform X3 [Dermacentor albipictus]|uniref:neprilysin-1-like isoform X3 n=1 Tax=Dermacentor albipictus TaxID=60249 RepID=UPI0038FD04DC
MTPAVQLPYLVPYNVSQGQLLLEPTHMGAEDTASSHRLRELGNTETYSTGLVMFCLLGMVPLLLTIAILGFFLFTQEPAPNVPQPATESKEPSITVGPFLWEQSATNEFPCGTNECRSLSERLRLQVKFTADPCDDFYDYVCGRYWGDVNGALSEVNAVMRSYTIASIGETTVPATGQKAWHKAAGLFKACVALAASHRSEVGDLTAWLATLGLDLNNLNPSVDPVDMIVRCSLDFGVEAVFAVRPSERSFIERKRSIEFKLSHAEELWHQYRHSLLTKSAQHGVDYYADTLAPYGVSAENTTMVYKIMVLENELIISLNKHMSVGSSFVIGTIEDMGLTTTPLVTSAQWEEMFSKYTNGIYGGRDKIAYQKELLLVLAELLGSPATGPAGLRCLVAWSLFRQLLSYAQLPQGAGDKETLYVCYQRVSDVMDLALNSHYLQSVVNYHAVYRALDMFARIREAFGAAIRNSSWLVGHERHVALRKLANMKALVGGPEHRWDEHYVEEYYDHGSRDYAWLRHTRSAIRRQQPVQAVGHSAVARALCPKRHVPARIPRTGATPQAPPGAQRHGRLGEPGRLRGHRDRVRRLPQPAVLPAALDAVRTAPDGRPALLRGPLHQDVPAGRGDDDDALRDRELALQRAPHAHGGLRAGLPLRGRDAHEPGAQVLVLGLSVFPRAPLIHPARVPAGRSCLVTAIRSRLIFIFFAEHGSWYTCPIARCCFCTP